MKLKNYINSLRNFRSYHKVVGLTIAILLLISAVTGILLSLKKEFDLLQPPTQKGASKQLADWMPLAELALLAEDALYTKYPEQANNPIERMDIRPGKGVVKVLFAEGWWEVQVDGSTGEIKSIAKRNSDWIEALHDGSIISDGFKLVSMNTLGIGLLIMIVTGLWLWYGPKKVRRLKKNRQKSHQ